MYKIQRYCLVDQMYIQNKKTKNVSDMEYIDKMLNKLM